MNWQKWTNMMYRRIQAVLAAVLIMTMVASAGKAVYVRAEDTNLEEVSSSYDMNEESSSDEISSDLKDDRGTTAESGSSSAFLHANAEAAPGKITSFKATTYARRKGLSKAKYKKKFRLVVLTWSRARDATRYKIQYSTSKSGTYKNAVTGYVKGTASGSSLTCKLSYKLNKTIYFKITPYNGTTAGSATDWVCVKVGNAKKNAASLTLTGGNATLYAGISKTYKATVKPAKPVVKGVRWSSSNSSVARVDSNGKVTGVSAGTAIIYAKAHNGIQKTATVTVKEIAAPSSVSVEWNIKSSKISWNSVSGADGYDIYSRVGLYGTEKKLASVGASVTSYVDTYYNTSTKAVSESLKGYEAYLKYTYYLDPAVNPLAYTVYAYKKVTGGTTCSDGVEDFHLETPAIVSATEPADGKVSLTWGKSMMADSYYVYRGDGTSSGWERLDIYKANTAVSGSVRITKSLAYDSTKPYYTVRAYSKKNGETVKSSYDTTFRVDGKGDYTNQRVLFIGDSITYGTPYTAVTKSSDPYYPGSSDTLGRYGFSFPRRLYELTGARFTNLSSPGATYTYLKGTSSTSTNASDRRCLTLTPDQAADDTYYREVAGYEALETLKSGQWIIKSIIDYVDGTVNGSTAVKKDSGDIYPGTFADYDVVILSAGTNDASRNAPLGDDLSSTDNTNFTGAVNSILTEISKASKTRSKPIKVVFVDLLYREHGGDGIMTKVTTFQNRLNEIAARWNAMEGASGMHIYSYNHNFLTSDNVYQLSSDTLHLTRFAQGQFGSKLTQYMIDQGILTK